MKWYGEQNAETPSPDIGNPIIEIHAKGCLTSFKYKDGSMAPLNLWLPAGQSASVWQVPVSEVARVILYYWSESNQLRGISMVDRNGNTIMKTNGGGDSAHTISLQKGESIVGYRSRADDNGTTAGHYDFQLIIAREVEETDDEEESKE